MEEERKEATEDITSMGLLSAIQIKVKE